MASNIFGGSYIRLDKYELERGLQAAKKNGQLHIDYSKIRSFVEALVETAEGKTQIAKYELGDLLEKVRMGCNISNRDIEEIENVFMGETGEK